MAPEHLVALLQYYTLIRKLKPSSKSLLVVLTSNLKSYGDIIFSHCSQNLECAAKQIKIKKSLVMFLRKILK